MTILETELDDDNEDEPLMAPTNGRLWITDDAAALDGIAFLRGQPDIAVYFNPRGEVVIRQECSPMMNEDAMIYIAKDRLPVLIALLQKANDA